MESRAKNRVDNDVGFLDEVLELLARGANDDLDLAAGRAPRNVARELGENLVGLDRRDDVDRDPLVRKDVGHDPTIAAVIAKTAENEHVVGVVALDHVCREVAGKLHELGL